MVPPKPEALNTAQPTSNPCHSLMHARCRYDSTSEVSSTLQPSRRSRTELCLSTISKSLLGSKRRNAECKGRRTSPRWRSARRSRPAAVSRPAPRRARKAAAAAAAAAPCPPAAHIPHKKLDLVTASDEKAAQIHIVLDQVEQRQHRVRRLHRVHKNTGLSPFVWGDRSGSGQKVNEE